MAQTFIMATPSREFIENFNLLPKATLSQWLELQRAIIESGGEPVIVNGEADTGRLGVFWKKALPSWNVIPTARQSIKLAAAVSYENVVYDANKKILWYGFASDTEFKMKAKLDEIFECTDITVRALPIESAGRFPTLSHCMNVLQDGTLLWHLDSFAEHARNVLESFYPRNVTVEDEDAANYVCGCITVGRNVITGPMSSVLKTKLSMSKNIIEIDTREWVAKKLTLKSLANEIIE